MKFFGRFFLIATVFLASSQAFSKELTFIFGIDRPPYIFGREDKGIDYDVVKSALALKGHTLRALHSPNSRGMKELQLGKVNGFVGIAAGTDRRLFYSEPYAYYNNVIIAKKKRNIKLEKLEDLKNYKFVAFQGAKYFLGNRYEKVVSSVDRKTEIASQNDQNRLFWMDKIDVIILDLSVFKWYRKNLKVDTSDEVVVYDKLLDASIPGVNGRVVGFVDKKLRDEFNDGLLQLKSMPAYQAIIDRHLSGL